MEIEEFIRQVDQQGHQWVADEMRLYHERPEILLQGDMVPNFEHHRVEESLPQLYFYFGMAFGVGMERKNDL